jgi:RNA polymerase sigma-70 factor (ECF subfamily)
MAGRPAEREASKHDAAFRRGIEIRMKPIQREGADMTTKAPALSDHQVDPGRPDAQSRAWITDLEDSGQRRDEAVSCLHELLLRAARFEVNRRRATLPHLRGNDFDDLAMQSADDALVAVLSKLDSYRGDSKFTTWAYKFALLEAAVKLRRRAWQGREVPLEPETWPLFSAGGPSLQSSAEYDEFFEELQKAISHQLTPHQREVLVAITLNGVPIDVLAERLNTTRGALYKTLHDARHKLRAYLADRGMSIGEEGKEDG